MKERIVFFDEYCHDTDYLIDTLENVIGEHEGVVLTDTLNLPDTYNSIYDYYLRKNDTAQWSKKDIFYVFLDIPKYWEVRADNLEGIIVNNNKTMAKVHFKSPLLKRNVESVDWLREDGTVYKKDIYNKYGFVYRREFFDKGGSVLSKSYYTSSAREIININCTNGCVCLMEEGRTTHVFGSVEDFESYAICDIVVDSSVIFTSVKQAKGYMNYHNNFDGCSAIALWKKDEITKCTNESLHTKLNCPLYMFCKDGEMYSNNIDQNEYSFTFSKVNYPSVNGNGEALIYTWLDNLNGINELIAKVPEVKFHIAAKTNVSQKLMDMSMKDNVIIHPAVTSQEIKELFEKCDFYLDINAGNEVDDAIITACMNGMIVMGCEGYLHNRVYMLEENIFSADEVDNLSQKLRHLAQNKEELELIVSRQQEKNRQVMMKKEELS